LSHNGNLEKDFVGVATRNALNEMHLMRLRSGSSPSVTSPLR